MISAKDKKPPFRIFAAASIAWLLVAGFVGWTAEPPQGCPGTFSCLAANEWGDYLAGVFAPLAFLWLIAAVVLQSRELAAQRDELALTREEMREQRGVLAAQAEEARKQAEFIGLQTGLMQRQEDERREGADLDEFDEKIAEAQMLVQQNLVGKDSLFVSDGAHTVWVGYNTNSRSPEQLIAGFSDFLCDPKSSVGYSEYQGFIELARPTAIVLDGLVGDVIELGNNVNGRRDALIMRLKLIPLKHALASLLKRTERLHSSKQEAT